MQVVHLIRKQQQQQATCNLHSQKYLPTLKNASIFFAVSAPKGIAIR